MTKPMIDIQDTKACPDWNRLAEDVHACAVDHGWYEQAPSMPSVFSNIHAELSEAWEAYRDHRPMVYYPCNDGRGYLWGPGPKPRRGEGQRPQTAAGRKVCNTR